MMTVPTGIVVGWESVVLGLPPGFSQQAPGELILVIGTGKGKTMHG